MRSLEQSVLFLLNEQTRRTLFDMTFTLLTVVNLAMLCVNAGLIVLNYHWEGRKMGTPPTDDVDQAVQTRKTRAETGISG